MIKLKRDRAEVLTWLVWVVASPLTILGLTVFLLSGCAPVDPCPDLRCEYGYIETPGDTGDKDEDNDGQGEDVEKGEADTGKGGRGKGDKGKDGDDD